MRQTSFRMAEETIFNNKNTFQIDNDSVVLSEIMYSPILLECFNIIILTTSAGLIHSGIEISHPVYGVLFCNLVTTLISSLLNAIVFPFVKNINFMSLVNGNSVACLMFHCSSWCILSVLRYLYIIHKSWIEKKLPNHRSVFLLSMFGVFFLFSVGLSSVIVTVIQLGWPAVKIGNMPSEAKAICLFAIFGYFFLLLGISCCFYILILRKRGIFGHNNVHILDKEQVGEMQVSTITFHRTNAPQLEHSQISVTIQNEERTSFEMTSFSNQSQEKRFNLQNEKDLLEQKRRQAEIQSAVRSLETNFVLSLIVILTFLIGALFSNAVGTNIFIFLKGCSPILTTIINFVKIQQLVQPFFENLLSYFAHWRQKSNCCSCFCSS